jgi:hypothetical protein
MDMLSAILLVTIVFAGLSEEDKIAVNEAHRIEAKKRVNKSNPNA